MPCPRWWVRDLLRHLRGRELRRHQREPVQRQRAAAGRCVSGAGSDGDAGWGWGVTWSLSNRFDRAALPLADRHYNRQRPGSPQFVPPGRCLVLTQPGALWVTSWPYAEYTQHAWAGAWVNTMFRRESGPLASELIRAAVACTRAKWPDPPPLGMVTFVDAGKVKHKRDPGRCYLRAGFTRVGLTQGGLVVFQMLPDAMPEPCEPLGWQMPLLRGCA